MIEDFDYYMEFKKYKIALCEYNLLNNNNCLIDLLQVNIYCYI